VQGTSAARSPGILRVTLHPNCARPSLAQLRSGPRFHLNPAVAAAEFENIEPPDTRTEPSLVWARRLPSASSISKCRRQSRTPTRLPDLSRRPRRRRCVHRLSRCAACGSQAQCGARRFQLKNECGGLRNSISTVFPADVPQSLDRFRCASREWLPAPQSCFDPRPRPERWRRAPGRATRVCPSDRTSSTNRRVSENCEGEHSNNKGRQVLRMAAVLRTWTHVNP